MSQLPLFQAPSWTVTNLTQHISQLLVGDYHLQDLWVTGEISNCRRPGSGHLYFHLKDRTSTLKCVMWNRQAMRLNFLPRDGDAVEVHGAIGVYETDGVYQLYADQIIPTGEGLLYQEFLRLKDRLEAEGLFDPARKRPIPRWIRCIGVVTSPTGAALRDILHTIERRCPNLLVVIAPTSVQGEEAPAGIAAAIQELERCASPDVVLVARGGGSIEDLWAFNDERVARAIAGCKVPVISGVGHETDFTIADFAADLRAPTPTAAAELATRDQEEMRSELRELAHRMAMTTRAVLAQPRMQLNDLSRRLQLQSPAYRLRSERQRLDDLSRRAELSQEHRLALTRARLTGLSQRLAALDPHSILQRGYAIVLTSEGVVVKKVSQVQPGDRLKIQVSDGELGAKVEGVEN